MVTTTRKPPTRKAAPRKLRAVPDEKPAELKPEPEAPPKKAQTLVEAIEAGVYLDILRAQRRQMVREVGDEKGPAKAAMHRQIALLSKEIAALEAEAAAAAKEDGEAGGDNEDADEAFNPEAL